MPPMKQAGDLHLKIVSGTPVDISIHVWEGQKGVLAFKDWLPLELARTVRHGHLHGSWNECPVLHASKPLLSLSWVCPFYRASDAKHSVSISSQNVMAFEQ